MVKEETSKKAKKPFYKRWWFWVIIAIVIFGIGGSFSSNTDDPNNPSETTVDSQKSTKKTLSLDEPFEFDNLEITLSSSLSTTTLDNEFSEYYKQTVIKMPVHIKNLDNETKNLNMFYYKFFGSKGTETSNVMAYFDDSNDSAGSLRSGAEYDTFFYFLYDGNGIYAIDFDNWSSKKTVEFQINI